MTNTSNIIYYGGSFNPPHLSHLLFVVTLRALYPDAEILIAPTYNHAFHKDLMDYDARLNMLHAMFDDIRGVTISTIERELNQPTSYTINVVRALKLQNPNCSIQIAVGADIVPTLPQWKSYDELLSLASFLIFPREGYDNTGTAPIPHLPEISSSEIRSWIDNNDWNRVSQFVPARVVDFLKSYQSAKS